ncbi:MAG: small basic protein [Phycisphaerae bacterium]|nr:small basic protein [Phycisphaerae bacterium]
MSLDKSLRSKNMLVRHRNVLTRAERIEVLKETGRWSEDSTALHLPKVGHRKAAVGKKTKTKAAEGEGEAKKEA